MLYYVFIRAKWNFFEYVTTLFIIFHLNEKILSIMLLYIQCIVSYFTEKNLSIEFIQLKRVTLIFTVYNYNGCTMHVNYSCKITIC